MLIVNYSDSSAATFVGCRNKRFIYARPYKGSCMTGVPQSIRVPVKDCTLCANSTELKMEYLTITVASNGNSQIESNVTFSKEIAEAIDGAFEALNNWGKRNMFMG